MGVVKKDVTVSKSNRSCLIPRCAPLRGAHLFVIGLDDLVVFG